MPTDNASRFVLEMVEPTVAEFLAEPSDKRRGCLACLALASMTEHYHAARISDADSGAFKGAVRKECPPMGWISDVANATKHVIAFKDRIGFEDVQSKEMGRFGVQRFGWPFSGTEVLVGDNSQWRLTDLVQAAMTFWRGKLYEGVAA